MLIIPKENGGAVALDVLKNLPDMIRIFLESTTELALATGAIVLSTGIAYLALQLLCRGIEQKLHPHQ